MTTKTFGKYVLIFVALCLFVAGKMFLAMQGVNIILAAGISGGIVGGTYFVIAGRFFPDEEA